MAQRSSSWSVTINNPIAADEENIALARQKGWRVEGQLEKGDNGTPHYQLLVKTPQVRFAAVKKQFPRAHIEIARNVAALEQYVHKSDTRESELPSQQEQYPSLQKVWDLFAAWVVGNDKIQSFYDGDPDHRIGLFRRCIGDLIEEGYVVETIAVNPQVISCVKTFGEQILHRSLRRQTDRQTDKNNVEVDIQNGDDQKDEETSDQALCSERDSTCSQDSSSDSQV